MPITDRAFKRLTEANVGKAPQKRGVYALYEEKDLVFLGSAAGKADTIRSRLRAHLASSPGAAMRYKREPHASPAARLKSLLGEYRKSHGKLPALNAKR